jgi:signal transduction histidine kinase
MTSDLQSSGTSDFASLADRMRGLTVMRLGFVVTAVGAGVFAPGISGGLGRGLIVPTAGYLAIELVLEILRRRGAGRRLAVLGGALLLDGVYLMWMVYLTGDARSPFQFLLYGHLVAVTLMGSYRTGLKTAAWDSLLFLVTAFASRSELLPSRSWITPFDSTTGAVTRLLVIDLAGIWLVALATASAAAVTERALRRKRADLERLSTMVKAIDAVGNADQIPGLLLDELRSTFGFERGLVLASPREDLSVMASVGCGRDHPPPEPGTDTIVERALRERTTVLVQSLDPAVDPRLDALLPGARNVVIVPLFVERGDRLGVLVVEHGGRSGRIPAWTVTIVGQFAAHAALALRNAWLLDENVRKLDEIRSLRDELLEHNARLESRVAERTRELTLSLEELRSAQEARQRLLSHLVRAEEEERRRIAGDLHDDPVQGLAAVAMGLDVLARSTGDPRSADAASKIREIVRSTIAGLRSLTFELHPRVLEEEGVAAALRAGLKRRDIGAAVEIDDRFDREPPTEPRTILYRIAQEALTNVRKHAMAARVHVTLEHRDGVYRVKVADDGVGFSATDVRVERAGHMGLSSMRERAELAGGGCRILSLPEGGTTVEFWVPDAEDGARTVDDLRGQTDDTSERSGPGSLPTLTPLDLHGIG